MDSQLPFLIDPGIIKFITPISDIYKWADDVIKFSGIEDSEPSRIQLKKATNIRDMILEFCGKDLNQITPIDAQAFISRVQEYYSLEM